MPIIFILYPITEHYSHFDELSKLKLEVSEVSIQFFFDPPPPHWSYRIEQIILTVAGKESQLVAALHQHVGVSCNLRLLFN